MHVDSNLIKRAKTWIATYSAFALPARLLFALVVSLAAGAGLGFFAEYASYNWALVYGLRPPLEGIPYLRVAVAGLSAAAFLGGALAYLAAYWTAGLLLKQISLFLNQMSFFGRLIERVAPKAGTATATEAVVSEYRKWPLKTVAYLAIAMGLPSACIPIISHKYFGGQEPNVLWTATVSTLTFLSMLLAWKASLRIWVSIVVVLAFVVLLPASLFHPAIFSRILQELGYGGGLPVSIEVALEGPQSGKTVRVEGHLMLRTTGALIIYEPAFGRMREISIQNVIFLDHAAKPVSDRTIRLPPLAAVGK